MFSVKNGIQQTNKGNKHINATTNLSRLISYCCRSLSVAVIPHSAINIKEIIETIIISIIFKFLNIEIQHYLDQRACAFFY